MLPFADADLPFLEVLWSMLIFMGFLLWIWLAITCFSDIFRRRDWGGFTKAIWVIFIIVIPYVGVLLYLIISHNGMAERSAEAAAQMQQAFDERVRDAAGGSAGEIEKAHELLKSGAIDQAEFDRLKAKAIGS